MCGRSRFPAEQVSGKVHGQPLGCAAFALDLTVRAEGLQQLLSVEYDSSDCYDNTLNFIQDWVKVYQEALKGSSSPTEEEVKWVKKHARVNKFASSRYKAGHQEITHDVDDPWECYNSEMKRFETVETNPYWGIGREWQSTKRCDLWRWSRRIYSVSHAEL